MYVQASSTHSSFPALSLLNHFNLASPPSSAYERANMLPYRHLPNVRERILSHADTFICTLFSTDALSFKRLQAELSISPNLSLSLSLSYSSFIIHSFTLFSHAAERRFKELQHWVMVVERQHSEAAAAVPQHFCSAREMIPNRPVCSTFVVNDQDHFVLARRVGVGEACKRQ